MALGVCIGSTGFENLLNDLLNAAKGSPERAMAEQIVWTGEPTLSRYDPPFAPWFMRRNEIWLTVQTDS